MLFRWSAAGSDFALRLYIGKVESLMSMCFASEPCLEFDICLTRYINNGNNIKCCLCSVVFLDCFESFFSLERGWKVLQDCVEINCKTMLCCMTMTCLLTELRFGLRAISLAAIDLPY